jgi:hypothetical protein
MGELVIKLPGFKELLPRRIDLAPEDRAVVMEVLERFGKVGA